MAKKLNIITKMLIGGDLRSIGKSDEVVKKVVKEAELIELLYDGFFTDDPVVRMRTADVLEKVSRKTPNILMPFKKSLIKKVSQIDQQEVQWHLAQIYPRLILTEKEIETVRKILINWALGGTSGCTFNSICSSTRTAFICIALTG